MSAEVHALMRPDRDAMLAHLDHLFGGYLDGYHDGLIELAWTDSTADVNGRYKLRHAQLFGTDEFEELADKACEVNLFARTNVYLGAALRRPDAPRTARCNDGDFYAATAYWSDLDDADANAQAKHRFAGGKPTFVVRTGLIPHPRHQLWWRLSEPVTDPARLEAAVKGLSVALSGDGGVYNPSRVMRLAGSIAWDQKPGRKPEVTGIYQLREPGPATYLPDHVEHIYTPLYDLGAARERREKGERGPDVGIVKGKSLLGFETGLVVDGREKYMRNLICARLIDYIGRFGAAPTGEELFDDAWPAYEETADLSRPGRGRHEFMDKCRYTVARFLRSEIPGVKSLDDAVRIYREKKEARLNNARHQTIEEEAQRAAPPPPGGFIRSGQRFVEGFVPPDYILDGIIQRGYLYSLAARTGHGKTAVSMFIMQCIARGLALRDREVEQGAVLYLAGENPDDIKARYLALSDNAGFSIEDVKIDFVEGVFSIKEQFDALSREAEARGGYALVVVDTAAAYFDGTDTNSNQEQGEFARTLRKLTTLPGRPAVLVPAHPVKNAARDNLLPLGGSAFLNEVDGNLTLWSNAEKVTTLHWQGKIRGPEFDPISFKMETVFSDRVKNAKGVQMPNVVARPLGDIELANAEAQQETDENRLLFALHQAPRASMVSLAKACGFVNEEGKAVKARVQRLLAALASDKLVTHFRNGKYELSAKGRKAIGVGGDDE